MAVLTPTKITRVVELGGAVVQTFRVTIANAAAADEWVDTGLSTVSGVLGWAFAGIITPTQVTATPVVCPNFVLNARGTGVAEGTNLGDLGIEISVVGTFDVTVIGLP